MENLIEYHRTPPRELIVTLWETATLGNLVKLIQKLIIVFVCSATLTGCGDRSTLLGFKMESRHDAEPWRFTDGEITLRQTKISYYPGRDKNLRIDDGDNFMLGICVSQSSSSSEKNSIGFYGAEISLTESGKIYIGKLEHVGKLTRFTRWDKYDPVLDHSQQKIPETADIPPDYRRCFNYKFDINAFNSTETFDVSIKGMRVDGLPVSVPTVRFHTVPPVHDTCWYVECFISH